MNKEKYFIINGDYILGIVYESEKYGRTLVLRRELNPNYPIKIYERGKGKISDGDIMEFIHSLLPQNP